MLNESNIQIQLSLDDLQTINYSLKCRWAKDACKFLGVI